MASEPESGILLICEGAYRLLLQLYPRRFREEWGLDMSRTFRDHSRMLYQREGIPGVIGLWTFTALDVVKTALEERAQTGEWFMSKDTVIRIGGPMMMIGGVLWVLFSLSILETIYLDRFGGYPIYEIALVVASIPILIGCLGLAAHAGPSGTLRAAAWLVVGACAGTTLASAAILVLDALHDDQWWRLLMVSFPMLFVAVLIFGMVELREKRLPHWNAAPLITGAVSAIAFPTVASGAMDEAFGAWSQVVLVALIGIGWLVLGYAMLPIKARDAAPTQP